MHLRRTAGLAAAGLLTLLGLATPAHAAGVPPTATGDSRSVSQPVLPPICTTLSAQLAPTNRQFSSADEQNPPDTARIQTALNSCKVSGSSTAAVELTGSGADNAFLSGPLTVGPGVVLLINSGTTLYASLNPADYQVSGGATCGSLSSSSSTGCQALITVDGAGAGVMGIRSASGAQGMIDGRGDLDMYGTSTSWWQLSANAKSAGDKQNNPRMIEVSNTSNVTVYDLDIVNAPLFHIYAEGVNGLTVWGVRIKTPATARNTDGIDPDSSTNVTINQSYIQDGDDGVAIKTNSAAAANITVENSNFYGTHGMSIGSETNYGITNVLFQNNTVNGSDTSGNVSGDNNGIRIKSYPGKGGTVSQVTYDDTCMTGVKHALEFNPAYSSGSGSIPEFTDVVVNGAVAQNSVSGAGSLLDGYNSSNLLGLTLENVSLDATSTSAQYANIGLYNTDISPSGTGVTVTSVSGSGSVPSCTFPAYPGL
ncbi:polygalacturonase [Streptacidiphilus sp. BW17]|uniref:glycoside hydrolase family 28 protein n=1 Tax=Streptacidiphilus sp. BW17 TaxID=3156274 RepID=UPI0035124ED9